MDSFRWQDVILSVNCFIVRFFVHCLGRIRIFKTNCACMDLSVEAGVEVCYKLYYKIVSTACLSVFAVQSHGNDNIISLLRMSYCALAMAHPASSLIDQCNEVFIVGTTFIGFSW